VKLLENFSIEKLLADNSKKTSKLKSFDLPGNWDNYLRDLFRKPSWNRVCFRCTRSLTI